jgi:hypothetical protein
MYDIHVKIFKDTFTAYFRAQFQHFPRETDKEMKKLYQNSWQPGQDFH